MEIHGKEIGLKSFIMDYCFNSIIILDMFLITIGLIFEIPEKTIIVIQYFVLIVCLMLLGEYAWDLHKSSQKKEFILKPLNIIGLIASIPFDFILVTAIPGSILLRYLRLFKISRIFLLSTRLKFIEELCEKTGLHKILGGLMCTVILFTILFYLFGPSYGGFDDFYFVVVTLTTVGYGDITPKTYNEKILSIMLILIGIFVFSTITALMSSFLTDRLVGEDEEDIKEHINESIEEKSDKIMVELKVVRNENTELKNEINQLKNEIKGLKELIKNK